MTNFTLKKLCDRQLSEVRCSQRPVSDILSPIYAERTRIYRPRAVRKEHRGDQSQGVRDPYRDTEKMHPRPSVGTRGPDRPGTDRNRQDRGIRTADHRDDRQPAGEAQAGFPDRACACPHTRAVHTGLRGDPEPCARTSGTHLRHLRRSLLQHPVQGPEDRRGHRRRNPRKDTGPHGERDTLAG